MFDANRLLDSTVSGKVLGGLSSLGLGLSIFFQNCIICILQYSSIAFTVFLFKLYFRI